MALQQAQPSDETLAANARGGDEDATATLVCKYIPLVRSRAASFYGPGLEQDDLVQEGFIGLLKAIRSYDPLRESSFRTFAVLCVTGRMMSAVRASLSSKHSPLRDYRSISQEGLAFSADVDPESYFIGKEEAQLLWNQIFTKLSSFERDALRLYLSGHSYREMSLILQASSKSVDNAIQRIRRKLKKV